MRVTTNTGGGRARLPEHLPAGTYVINHYTNTGQVIQVAVVTADGRVLGLLELRDGDLELSEDEAWCWDSHSPAWTHLAYADSDPHDRLLALLTQEALGAPIIAADLDFLWELVL